MAIVMVVIASPAANLGGLCGDNGNDGMVGNPAALDAVIVDYIP